MYYHDPKERLEKELAPGVRTRTFWGNNMLLSLVEIDPDCEVPRHTHPHEQGGMVTEGKLEMDVGGELKVLGPGEVYIIPGGVEHWVKAGNSTTKVLDIFSPVREEFKY